jgi:hypothetical protein
MKHSIITERVNAYYGKCLLTCSHIDGVHEHGDIVFACFTLGAPELLEPAHQLRTITRAEIMDYLRVDKHRHVWFTSADDAQELQVFEFDDWYEEMLETNKVGLCDIAEDIINHREHRKGFFDLRIFSLDTPRARNWQPF